MPVQNKKMVLSLTIYTALLFVIWSLCETWLKTQLLIAQVEWFREIILKALIWTIPTLALIRIFSGQLYIGFKEMFTKHVSWVRFVPILLLFTVYVIASALLLHGSLELSPQFSLLTIPIVLSIGIGEELVFRGWLLNAMFKVLGNHRKWLAIVIDTVLFLAIHFPLWLYTSSLMKTFADLGALAIVVLSVIFSLAFLKSRSIWPPVILHAYWNLLVITFIY